MAKNIGKLGIEVELDASKAQAGLSELVQKIELFQSSVSKFSSLALNLAGFASIGAIMGKIAYDGATFAAQMERAKTSSKDLLELYKVRAEFEEKWQGSGTIGRAMMLPGMAYSSLTEGFGRALSGSFSGRADFDELKTEMDGVRLGITGPFSGLLRSLGDFGKAIDDVSDMIVPWGDQGWWPNGAKGPSKDRRIMAATMEERQEIRAALLEESMDKFNDAFEKTFLTTKEKFDNEMKKLTDIENNILDSMFGGTGDDAKKNRTLANIARSRVELEIAALQAELEQINKDAQEELMERAARQAKIDEYMNQGLSSYEDFVRRNKDIIEKYNLLAEGAGGDELAKLQNQRDKLIEKSSNAFLRTGENQYEAIANDQKMALLELEKAEAAKNENAILVARRRLAEVTNRIANLTPEKYNVDPFSFGASVRGTTEFGRDMMAGMFPKEFVQDMDKRVEDGNRIVADKIGEGNKELQKLVDLAKAKPLNINWKGAAK